MENKIVLGENSYIYTYVIEKMAVQFFFFDLFFFFLLFDVLDRDVFTDWLVIYFKLYKKKKIVKLYMILWI